MLHIDGVDIELGGMLQKLKTIKRFSIGTRVNVDTVIKIIKHLPDLEYLGIFVLDYDKDDHLCRTILPGLTEIVDRCIKLTELTFGRSFKINSKLHTFYDAIVKLATGRIKTTINFRPRRINAIFWSYDEDDYDILDELLAKSNDWVSLIEEDDD